MRVLVHVNVALSSSLLVCHFAISDHRPSERFSALIEVAAILGCGRVSRKFHASHARTVDLPAPLALLSARRAAVGKCSSASSCLASGVAPKSSRTIEAGDNRQRLIFAWARLRGSARATTCSTLQPPHVVLYGVAAGRWRGLGSVDRRLRDRVAESILP